ncbi:MAG: acetolactate synthase small subunit [Candidatus Omnitrophica bacterium]|nr:acetolactate synthase small subunit [Candidatus Omnitrophota bacterium]
MTKPNIHTMSILVTNKPGVLVRIALVFARRGYNIDSLVVSPTVNPTFSRMTISAKGDPQTLEQIIKNVNKLVDVIHCGEHDLTHSIEKELALFKIKASPAAKAFINKHSHKFHIKINDASESHLIIEQTGTTAELDEFEGLVKKYDLVEMVRTGKVLMAKGREST